MFEYTHSNSIIHRLDPRTKMIYSIGMCIAVIFIYSLPILLFLLFIACLIWVSAKIPLKKQKKILKFLIIIIIICFGTQIFFYTGMPTYTGPRTVLIELLPVEIPIFGKLTITVEGLFHSLILTLKLSILFFSTIIIIYTTHPSEIMLILRKIRFPEWFSLLYIMSLRFIPLTIENFHQIRNAQRLRKPRTSLKDIPILFSTLIVVTLRTAKQMSLCLESKAFGYKKERTFLKTLEFAKKDAFFSLFFIFIIIFSLIQFYTASW